MSRDEKERYLRSMSDRLHDRFLERPAFLDLDFIRSEIKKLEATLDAHLAKDLPWPSVVDRVGDPQDYADAVFASRLLSPDASLGKQKASIAVVVLKILFIVAPVNFLMAAGPLLFTLIIALAGWILAFIAFIGPLAISLHARRDLGFSDLAFLVAASSLGLVSLLIMLRVTRVSAKIIWAWLGWNIAFLRGESRA